MLNKPFLPIAITILALSSCARGPAGPQIEVQDAWARPAPDAGGNGAIYLRLVNNGNEPDRLLGGESPVAAAFELHETTMSADDVMSMAPLVGGLEIPAHGEAMLEPGGAHMMLVELRQPLAAGDSVPITLQFKKSSAMTLEVEVREP